MSARPPSPVENPFELSGGELCLDFANTWGDRSRAATDRLHDYADVLRFARQTGCLDRRRLDRLVREADGTGARRARAAFVRATELREALHAIFSARAAGRDLRPGDLARLNAELAGAFRGARLEPAGGGFGWRWDGEPVDFEEPLRAIARSAAGLLTSPRLDRVRECSGEDCSWLFLDASRGGSRRWCSMASCGNRAKARRFYRRHRGGRLG